MNMLIFSDLHGSVDAASKICELSREFPLVLCLGDVLYHGPRNDLPASYNPKEVIKLVNTLSDKIVAVRGNCEAEVDQMVLTFPVLSTTAVVAADGQVMTLSHGHIYNEEALPPGSGPFLYGHTHIPVAKKNDAGRIIFNPGSTSIPKGGFPPTYGTYVDGVFSVHRLDDNEVLMSVSL